MHPLLKVCFSFGTLVCIILLSAIYRDSLFEKCLTVIPELQEGASTFKQTAWNQYSNWGLALINILPILLTYLIIG